jgi:hypothetical protein
MARARVPQHRKRGPGRESENVHDVTDPGPSPRRAPAHRTSARIGVDHDIASSAGQPVLSDYDMVSQHADPGGGTLVDAAQPREVAADTRWPGRCTPVSM